MSHHLRCFLSLLDNLNFLGVMTFSTPIKEILVESPATVNSLFSLLIPDQAASWYNY